MLRRHRPEWIFLSGVLRRDARALTFTIVGCTLSALVAAFQFAVFTSFLRVAHAVPDLIQASAWITGHRVAAFDFPFPVAQDYAGLAARCFPGASFSRVLFGFAPWVSPLGRRGNVAVVGFDGATVPPRSFVVDESDRERLDLADGRRDAEVGGLSMRLLQTDDRLSSFLGAPYVVVSLRDAARALRAPPERASFIAVHARTASGRELDEQVACAREAFPEVSTMSSREFNASTAIYWLVKTGAGGAILIASVLAAILMLIILVNGVSRFAQRRHRDFMSALAVGADPRVVRNVLLVTGALISFGSTAIAVALLPVADASTDFLVPWVFVKGVDLLFALVVASLGALAGFLAALREARGLRVVDVFREA
jgi:hypothetical protein